LAVCPSGCGIGLLDFSGGGGGGIRSCISISLKNNTTECKADRTLLDSNCPAHVMHLRLEVLQALEKLPGRMMT